LLVLAKGARAGRVFDSAEIPSLLLLILAARYWQITADDSLIQEEGKALVATVDYLCAHLRDGVFFEDPTRCGAERYALPATYWKDGGLPGRNDPDYPVVYALVQAQTNCFRKESVARLRTRGLGKAARGKITNQSVTSEVLLYNPRSERAKADPLEIWCAWWAHNGGGWCPAN